MCVTYKTHEGNSEGNILTEQPQRGYEIGDNTSIGVRLVSKWLLEE
jgi:hypothetical protein